MGVPAETLTTVRVVTASLDICSSEASPMLLLTRSRMRSDSLYWPTFMKFKEETEGLHDVEIIWCLQHLITFNKSINKSS
jgi:hypothetical protein